MRIIIHKLSSFASKAVDLHCLTCGLRIGELTFLGVGHSGGSTSTPSDARGTLDHSGDSGAGAVGQDVDSASEENSVPRGVLGKRRGEQLASGDRSEKKG